jgi:acyl carrier protein
MTSEYLDQQKNFKKFLEKKIGKREYKNLDPNENLIKAKLIDSHDLVEIIVFMEKKLNIEIDIYKIGGKKINITMNKLYKFYLNQLKKNKSGKYK